MPERQRSGPLTRIGEAINQHRQDRSAPAAPPAEGMNRSRLPGLIRWFLPNGGTLLLIAILIFTQNVWAGKVSDGLFNVMLGSLTPIAQSVITGNSTLFLGITVDTDDEMSPRVQLGSVPFAAHALSVPDGSITTAKISDGAVTKVKLGPDAVTQFGGQPNSYPYLVHLRHFALAMGNYCFGYVPGDPAIIGPYPECSSLDRFLAGTKFYSQSGNGFVGTANNLPDSSGGARWGYAFSYFLSNPGDARTITVPMSSCNDVALYVSTGAVSPDRVGDAYNLVYHRFPGNNDSNLAGCPCAGLDPSITIPKGPFRLTAITRGAACTSYINIGTPDTKWIQNINLAVDWENLRSYLGEK
ncbi:MAG: hypothetical protein KJZ86_22685 [Caldilineaceae bacterium]|nr:hypothetical protein [Caldilineaceae bacterium]HRJ43050.1 hypothetical protein [Caldilineaceae bacterium]